jgi:hypothetical protein
LFSHTCDNQTISSSAAEVETEDHGGCVRLTQNNLLAFVIVSATALKKGVSGQKPFMLFMSFMVNNAFFCHNIGREAILFVRPTIAIHCPLGD